MPNMRVRDQEIVADRIVKDLLKSYKTLEAGYECDEEYSKIEEKLWKLNERKANLKEFQDKNNELEEELKDSIKKYNQTIDNDYYHVSYDSNYGWQHKPDTIKFVFSEHLLRQRVLSDLTLQTISKNFNIDTLIQQLISDFMPSPKSVIRAAE